MKEDVNDHITLLNILREEVCVKLNKKIFYRTWDFGWLHTNKERYTRITDAIEPHNNLIFSIKYSNGDFHRNTWFNQTLGYGKHPYIVEFQGQPEYTGKGAYPVYMFGGMLRDYEENPATYPYCGMNDLKDDPRFVGVWTWSRGGGWRGPYIQNELYCDINTRAAAIWAQNRSLSAEQVLDKTLRALGVKSRSVKDFSWLLRLAETAVLKGRYSKLPEAAMNVWWTRDQFISDAGMLNETLERAVRRQHGLSPELLMEEKEESVALWKEIEALSRIIRMNNPADEKYIAVSATYGRILYEIYTECINIFLYLKKYELAHELNIDMEQENAYALAAISRYDERWEEFHQLYKDNPDLCATLYEPNGFSQSGRTVEGSYANGAAKSVDEARRLLFSCSTENSRNRLVKVP